jgi:tripartite-type tricarboxylate transporter receptor subunit TctC
VSQRHPLLPGTQTFVEAGVKDFVSFQWYGILGPAGLPNSVITTLNRSINKALAAPEVKDRFASLTFDSAIGSPADFRKLLVSEDQRWKDVVRQTKVRLD